MSFIWYQYHQSITLVTGYGKVLDIRINRGGGGSGKVPFGFVVFDSEEPVQTLLKMKVKKINISG